MKRRILFCLLCIFILTGLTSCGEDGVKVNSANALAKKLASGSAVKINVSKDIILDEPIVVRGEKEIVGNGKIVAAVEDGEELYMITVAKGGKLTVGGSVDIDAASLMGAIHVQDGGSAVIDDKAVVKNASEEAANVLVNGTLEVKGGNLKDAKGHNIINKKSTVVSGGKVIGSGEKYAGVYNEGTLTQSGGKVSAAYNNISNLKGSSFSFEGGTNEDSIRDGVFVAEGAVLKATNKDATIVNAGARGILLQGQADIKVITVKECGDSLVKVTRTGVLNLGNGILQGGNYHGVDNAGTMNMLGGNIQNNANCGIVNTGTLKITSGNISENANKGILNKHEGKADVTSAMVNFTSNKTAIANEDKAVFEFAKAKLLMSTQTNIYCYDGTMNIHDAVLNASTSNNVRIIDGEINMVNVEVKGNSQSSNTSHHGMMIEGGVVNAENVTISMTTGHGMRVKGGKFIGKNIVMHDINRVGVSMGKHDYLEQEGLVEIDGLEIQSTNYSNLWNEGGGTVKVKNAKLAVASSNSVRVNDGVMELTNVTVPGHSKGSANNVHGIYMEGGEIVAKNVSISNTSGNAIRNKNGKFTGTKINISNTKGDTAISNLPLDDDNKNGIIKIDGLTIKNSASKNITLDSGVTTIRNATLGAAGANNVKLQNNAATLNLYDVEIKGQHKDAIDSTHGIMVEGGNVFGEKVQITNTNACGIRCKLGVVDLKNVGMTEIGQAAISNGKMVKDDVELGVGKVKIDGLEITKVGTNNIVMDAGTVDITNAVLGKIETVNHNVKVTNTGVLTMNNVEVQGTTTDKRHAIITETGGDAKLTNVKIVDALGNAIHVNHKDCKVTGENVTIKDSQNGVYSTAGTITINNLTTENISGKNIFVGTNDQSSDKTVITVKNATLCQTSSHNVHIKDEDGSVTLENVSIAGSTKEHGIIAEGGDAKLTNVTIGDIQNSAKAAIRINKTTSKVTGEKITVKDAPVAVSISFGEFVDVDGLTTENIQNKNIFVDEIKDSSDKAIIAVKNAILCQTTSHNVHIKDENGSVTLEHAAIAGSTSGHGIMAEGGDAKLVDVAISDIEDNTRSGIRINKITSKVTGENVSIKNAPSGITGTLGTVTIEGFKTENIKGNNILAGNDSKDAKETEEKCIITITDGELCKTTSGHNVKSTLNGQVELTEVDVYGTASKEHRGIIVEKGSTMKLKAVTIQDVTGINAKNEIMEALYSNNVSNEVIAEDLTIKDCRIGIRATAGSMKVTTLTTSNIEQKNVVASGTSRIEILNGDLCETSEHNVHSNGEESLLTLKEVTIHGVTSAKEDKKYGAIAERGGDIAFEGVTIENVKANAIHINHADSKITGTDVTVSNANYAINASDGSVELTTVDVSDVAIAVNVTGGNHKVDGLTTSDISEKNVVAGGTSNVEILNSDLCATPKHNTHSNGSDSLLTLKDVTVKGVTSSGQYGIIAEKGGDVALEGVTIENVLANAIHINTADSKITGTDVTVSNAINGIYASNGSVELTTVNVSGVTDAVYALGGTLELKDLVTENVKGKNIHVPAEAATTLIKVKESVLCQAGSHSVHAKSTESAIELTDVIIQGTSNTQNHAIMAEGGDFVLKNVEISGAKASLDRAAIRINKPDSEVIGENITIKDCSYGISGNNGTVIITGENEFKANERNLDIAGGTFSISNAILHSTSQNNVHMTNGTLTLEDVEVEGAPGVSVAGNAILELAGAMKAEIQMDAAKAVIATKALAGSVIKLDWTEGKIPESRVAIEFASKDDMDATKGDSTITLGTNAHDAGYELSYFGTKLRLNNINNRQYPVKNFADLKEAMEEINSTPTINTATITLEGDITVTEKIVVEAGKTVSIQDNGDERSIKRAAEYTKGDLFEVKTGASLEFIASSGDNSNPTLKIDGGSKNDTPVITEPDSSFIRNSGTLTVGSGVQLANAKGSEDYCKALGIYAAEGSMTTFNGVMQSIVGQYKAPQGQYGFGIAITVGKTQDFVIENAIIKDNYTSEVGIIRLESGGKLTIKNSTFENNESVKEAGVISESGDANNRLTIEGSTFKNNKTSGNGGALLISCPTQENIKVTDTTFVSNQANEGGAVSIAGSGAVIFDSCTFTDNVAKRAANQNVTTHWGNDVRVGGAGGKVTIKGKMDVTIFNRNKSVLTVADNLEEGSKVVVDWSLDNKIPDNKVGIIYGTTDIMNASKAYISLGKMQSTEYVIKNNETTGTLVTPTKAADETELKKEITAISGTSDKIGFIKVTDNFTISATVSIPAGVNVTILDDGTARTITRAAGGINKTIFDVKSGATFALVSTSKDNSNPTLTIDGGSATIENDKEGASLINASGTVNVGKGVVLTNNKSSADKQGFGIYSQPGSVTTFSGVISNIEGTDLNVKGNVFVVKGAFILKDAIVRNNKAKAGSPIRVSGGQLTALNTIFQGNSTNGNGGALYADGTAGNTLTIDGCTFTGNTAGGHGGVISIDNKFDTNTIRNSKFINNTAGNEGGAINVPTGAFLTLENCEFTGNQANKVSAADSISGFGDIRVADNRSEGAIRISGKMIVDIYMNQKGKIDVVGALTEGSDVVANWRLTKIFENSFDGIIYVSEEVMNASKEYISLSDNYNSTYDLTFSGTSGILKKK